jgi:hypothetical protein
MKRMRDVPVSIVHAGKDPSLGRDRRKIYTMRILRIAYRASAVMDRAKADLRDTLIHVWRESIDRRYGEWHDPVIVAVVGDVPRRS